MKRVQQKNIIKDLEKKMVFLAGPRQVGKTWLAKSLLALYKNSLYLNYDNAEDREMILNQSWSDNVEFLVFDELHKMPEWKNYLKGVFDVKPYSQKILVTGSARLEIYGNVGDSLAGRYFKHRLLPFSLSELNQLGVQANLENLMSRGGYPEPYLADDDIQADRWRRQYVESLITTDVLDFQNVINLKAMRLIFNMLRERVGSTVSYQSIAEDVLVSPATVKKYITILEDLYIIFKITPYSKNIARSLLKEPKIYFYDTGLVKGDEGAKLENFIGMSLLKHTYGLQDYLGKDANLQYIRTKDREEIDFALVCDDKIEKLVEVKNSNTQLSATLKRFCKHYQLPGVQVVKNVRYSKKDGDIPIMKAEEFLKDLYL